MWDKCNLFMLAKEWEIRSWEELRVIFYHALGTLLPRLQVECEEAMIYMGPFQPKGAMTPATITARK